MNLGIWESGNLGILESGNLGVWPLGPDLRKGVCLGSGSFGIVCRFEGGSKMIYSRDQDKHIK